MSVIVNPHDWQPEPSSQICRRLEAIRPGLTLKYSPFEKCFYAWLPWAPDNPAWARVRSGELEPSRAFDIIGHLPLDCSVDDAPALLERQFREFPREDVQKMAAAVREWNATEPARQQVDAVVEAVMADPVDPVVRPDRGKKHR